MRPAIGPQGMLSACPQGFRANIGAPPDRWCALSYSWALPIRPAPTQAGQRHRQLILAIALIAQLACKVVAVGRHVEVAVAAQIEQDHLALALRLAAQGLDDGALDGMVGLGRGHDALGPGEQHPGGWRPAGIGCAVGSSGLLGRGGWLRAGHASTAFHQTAHMKSRLRPPCVVTNPRHSYGYGSGLRLACRTNPSISFVSSLVKRSTRPATGGGQAGLAPGESWLVAAFGPSSAGVRCRKSLTGHLDRPPAGRSSCPSISLGRPINPPAVGECHRERHV